MLQKEKVSRKKLLEFIKNNVFVQPWQLAEEFGYTQGSACKKIMRLHRAGLIDNSVRGKWNLTDDGERRLQYYYAHEKKTGTGTEGS